MQELLKLSIHNHDTGLRYSWFGTQAEINKLVTKISNGESVLGSCCPNKDLAWAVCDCRVSVKVEPALANLTKRIGD